MGRRIRETDSGIGLNCSDSQTDPPGTILSERVHSFTRPAHHEIAGCLSFLVLLAASKPVYGFDEEETQTPSLRPPHPTSGDLVRIWGLEKSFLYKVVTNFWLIGSNADNHYFLDSLVLEYTPLRLKKISLRERKSQNLKEREKTRREGERGRAHEGARAGKGGDERAERKTHKHSEEHGESQGERERGGGEKESAPALS